MSAAPEPLPTEHEIASNDATRPLETTSAGPPISTDIADWELRGGRYRVLGEIARGGMGIVLRVHDVSFDRPLAVKVLLPHHGSTADHERRFLDEAAITGQLQHPGIPPVHEVGRLADGRPFFSMKLIEGRTLAKLLRERATPQSELPSFLKMFEQIAQTLAYAHAQGIIHRDLKPANIMVGAFGEVQVMDWGVAKRLSRDERGLETPLSNAGRASVPADASLETHAAESALPEDSHTQPGQILGTFTYMAPEQARGEIHALDERSDVFGLGAILCMILTGKPPYAGTDSKTIWQHAQAGDLTAAWACLDACGADRELVSLAKACLAPLKTDRPRHAGAVAEAVAEYFAGVQERLHQERVAHAAADVQAREERKRRRLAVGLAGAVILLVVGAGGTLLWYTREQSIRSAETAARATYLEHEVSAALDEAERLRRELHEHLRDERRAAQLLSDLDEWRGHMATAHAAWQRADRLAGGGRNLLPKALQDRLIAIAESQKSDERDWKTAVDLDRIRLESTDPVEGEIELWRAGPKLLRVFADAGFDLEKSDPAELAGRIRQSPIRAPLVAALDFLALVTREAKPRGRFLEIARGADPDPWRDRFRQIDVWDNAEKLNAMARQADLAVQSPHLLTALGQRLRWMHGDAPDLLRRALVQHPRDFWLHFELGMASDNLAEQAGAFRAALSIRPDSATVYYSLGVIQAGARKLDEALACYRRAVELDAGHAGALNNLGLVLAQLNRRDEAMEWYRKAIAANPHRATPHINLGAALQEMQRFDEAIVHFEKAIEIDPNNGPAHNNLGVVLRQQKKLDAAIACFRKTLVLQPNHSMAWCNLGHALRERGDFEEALAALRKGHEFGSRESDWTYPSAQWIKDAENSVELEKKLAAVLAGTATPADAREQLALAELCAGSAKQWPATATRFYAAAFAAEPKLADALVVGHRYKAACAAARAAADAGRDTAKAAAAERTAWRKQAHAWLAAELAAWSDAVEKRSLLSLAAAKSLQPWSQDPAFHDVRDEAALAQLPADESRAWRHLWMDLAALQRKIAKRPTPMNSP